MNRFSSRTLFRAIAAPLATLPTGRIAPLHTTRYLQSTGGYGNSTTSGQSTGTSSPKSSEDASAQSGGSRSKEAVETGSSPTGGQIPNAPEGKKSSSSSSSSSGQSNTSTSNTDDKFAMPDALANGDARGRTGGGEPLSSSHRSAPPQPKISNASVPGETPNLTKEQQAEVDEHNKDFENKHGRAEPAEDDKVNPKFWGGGGRRLKED
ncbi:hypothetical protein B0H65DRAFT_474837 [Neurospora tetraspora]|uniref:Uncharacterized protein n=1 Tax=Neurospora tetraspora TaxID=94610 RepID=A0AAE0J8F0_9PEZI|nr:hypothetical protein B0H65DRAFT_474837 [Neurospora tetraspora]